MPSTVHAIDQGYARVREIEEKTVTPAMRRIEAEDPDRHLVGLEHRLKGRERIEEKVTHDEQKKGLSAGTGIRRHEGRDPLHVPVSAR